MALKLGYFELLTHKYSKRGSMMSSTRQDLQEQKTNRLSMPSTIATLVVSKQSSSYQFEANLGADLFKEDSKSNGTALDETLKSRQLLSLCKSYLYGPSDDKPSAQPKYNKNISFFSNLKAIAADQALEVADHILWGRADEAVKLIEINPSILFYCVEATDPVGRRVKGNLLQIAAMAGDVNLKPASSSSSQPNDGLVERLAEAANLSKNEVVKQLAPIFSKEAMQENKNRNNRILTAIKDFGKGLLAAVDDAQGTFTDFQMRYQYLIDNFRNALKPNPDEIITSGYIFDPNIICDALRWCKTHLNTHHDDFFMNLDNKILMFWINCIGSLQSVLSARDAQAACAGMSRYIDDGRTPPRTDLVDFYNPVTQLGIDSKLNYLTGEMSSLLIDGEDATVMLNAWQAYARMKSLSIHPYTVGLQDPESSIKYKS